MLPILPTCQHCFCFSHHPAPVPRPHASHGRPAQFNRKEQHGLQQGESLNAWNRLWYRLALVLCIALALPGYYRCHRKSDEVAHQFSPVRSSALTSLKDWLMYPSPAKHIANPANVASVSPITLRRCLAPCASHGRPAQFNRKEQHGLQQGESLNAWNRLWYRLALILCIALALPNQVASRPSTGSW
jgi:hypothetical protein